MGANNRNEPWDDKQKREEKKWDHKFEFLYFMDPH